MNILTYLVWVSLNGTVVQYFNSLLCLYGSFRAHIQACEKENGYGTFMKIMLEKIMVSKYKSKLGECSTTFIRRPIVRRAYWRLLTICVRNITYWLECSQARYFPVLVFNRVLQNEPMQAQYWCGRWQNSPQKRTRPGAVTTLQKLVLMKMRCRMTCMREVVTMISLKCTNSLKGL